MPNYSLSAAGETKKNARKYATSTGNYVNNVPRRVTEASQRGLCTRYFPRMDQPSRRVPRRRTSPVEGLDWRNIPVFLGVGQAHNGRRVQKKSEKSGRNVGSSHQVRPIARLPEQERIAPSSPRLATGIVAGQLPTGVPLFSGRNKVNVRMRADIT